MAISLVRVDEDTGAAGTFSGGPAMPAEGNRFLTFGGSTPFVNNWTKPADVLTNTTAVGVSGMSAGAVHPTLAQIAIPTALFTVTIYNYNRTTGVVGSAIASSASSGFILFHDVIWSPDGAFLIAISSQSPYIRSISWDGVSTFGAWVTAGTVPGAPPTNAGRGAIEFSPNGLFVAAAVGNTTHNGLMIFGYAAGVLTLVANRAVSVNGTGVSWHPSGLFVAMGINGSPYVSVHSWNGTALGAAIVPSVVHANAIANRVLWDKNGQYLIVCGSATPTLYSYPWDGAALGAGATATDPPGNAGRAMVLFPDNTRLAVVDQDNDVDLYSTNLTLIVNPTVTSVAPDVGSLDGGDTVVVTGTGFLAGAQVTFDGVAATGEVVDSSTQITCVTPAHAVGAVNVVVTNTDTGFGTLVNGFTYEENPPSGGLHVPNVASVPTLPHLGR